MTAAYHKCSNCGRDFADHNYVAGSVDKYACPHPQKEVEYGSFTGGDPRKFTPDPDCATPEEIANHKRACGLANRVGSLANLDCPSGYERLPDGGMAHVLKLPFGLGVQVYEIETHFEAADASDSDLERWSS